MLPACSIFISYRRSDSNDVTGRIYDRLKNHFGKEVVFKDVDSIPYGADIRNHLKQSIGRCQVLIAVIGNTWTTELEQRSEDAALDWVVEEIKTAIEQGIPVIPVLVKGANMPAEKRLPDSLKPLAYRHAAKARTDPDFHGDLDRLISHLEKVVKEPSPEQVKSVAQTKIHNAQFTDKTSNQSSRFAGNTGSTANSTSGSSTTATKPREQAANTSFNSATAGRTSKKTYRHLFSFFEKVHSVALIVIAALLIVITFIFGGLSGGLTGYLFWLRYLKHRNFSLASTLIVSTVVANVAAIFWLALLQSSSYPLHIPLNALPTLLTLFFLVHRHKR